MKSKIISAILLSQILLLASLGTAHAALSVRISSDNGTNWVVVDDNGPLDSDPELGGILCLGPISGWALSITSGQGAPFIGNPDVPNMDLLTINTSGSPANLIAQLSADNLTTFSNQTYIGNISIDTDGTIVNNDYYDSSNVLFGTTQTYSGGTAGSSPSATAVQVFSTGSVSGATFVSNGIVVSATGTAPHSVTLETIINHSGAQSTSVHAHLFANPQPTNSAPSAQSQSVTLNEDLFTNVTLQGTDAESDPLTFAIVTPPAHGILTNVPSSNQYIYVPAANYFGTDSFLYSANDGHTTSTAATVDITVLAQNDAPQLTVPGTQLVGDAMPLVFDTNRLISVSDVDAGSGALELSLSVAHGTIALSNTNGLVLESGANDSTNIVVQGDLPHLNAGISNLTYTSVLHFSGTDNLFVSVNDLGNTGAGGALTDSNSIAISVVLTNHAPVFVSTPVTNTAGQLLPAEYPAGVRVPDLKYWKVLQYGSFGQGPANWSLSQSNTVALQSLNADASALVSDFTVFRDVIQGTLTALDTSDDDFIGFIFGYQNSSNFYLFDWKQADQTSGTFAERGMTVKVITCNPNLTGIEPLWSTHSVNSTNAHTLFHNAIPYETFTNYQFTLDFQPGNFTIQVNNGTNVLANIHLTDTTFPSGKFGFYNFSQPNVRYSGFTRQLLDAHTYTYQAAATDSDGDALTYSLVSGPTNMTVNATNGLVQWFADDTVMGTVDVTLQVTDSHGAVGFQTFTIIVTPLLVNQAPFVYAGPERSFFGITNVITLNGVVADDGVPAPLQIAWSKLFGPGTVTFGNSNSAVTTASFSTNGIYLLQLYGSDSYDSSNDVVAVRVNTLCSVEPPPGMVAWWPADFSAEDKVTGIAGYISNTNFPAGKVAAAFSFSTAGSYVQMPGGSNYDVGTSSNGFTVEFWGNPSSFFQNGGVLGWANGPRAERFTTSATGDSLRFFVTGTNATNFVDAPRLWTSSTFAHVAMTYDRSTAVASLYVNGMFVSSANVGTNVMPTTGDFFLNQVPGSAGSFGGLLDEISIYSRPLNAEEIFNIFNAGSAGKCPFDPNTPPSVFAGPDLFVRGVPGVTNLQGEVLDDGLPLNSQSHIQWTKFSGPGTVSFADASSPTTSATFSTNGIYVLQLTADDGEVQVSDLVEVRVEDFCSVDNPPGLAAWWPGNGIEKEAINGYDAIKANGAGYAVGEVASAFNFDGVNDYVRMPAQTNFDVGASASGFSVEFWMNAANFQNGSVLGWDNGVRAERFNGGSINGDSLRWYIGGTNSGQFLVSQRLWADSSKLGKWVHIVLTYQRPTGLATLYVNGLVNAVGSVGTNVLSTTGDFYLQNVPGSASFFTGQLDEVSLYSRPLSRLEAVSLFESGSVGKCLEDADLRPQVYAGPDIAIASTNIVANLSGFVSDDGLPVGSVITTKWQPANFNPGTVTFGSSNSLTSTATFSTNGVYALQLVADDGEKQSSDFVEVRVGVSCPVLDIPGLVAWWPANGNAVDKISGNAAVLVGADYTNGEVAQSFNLHGTNDFVFVLARTNYDVGQSTNGFTLELWARGQFISGSDHGILSWNNSATNGSDNGISLGQSGSAVFYDVRDVSGVDHSIGGSGGVFDGSWHHVALTYDRVAGQLKTYVDGALRQTVSAGNFQPQTSYDLQFGRALGFPAGNFTGQFDEIALYNRALALTEIQSIFNAGAAGKCITPSNNPPFVSAGPDQVVTLPNNAVLNGLVLDDGLPSNTLAIAWTYIAGDSTVFFSSTNTAVTTVAFTNAGTYTFQLTASDGQFTTNDAVTVSVLPDLRARPTVAITAPANESLFEVPIAGTTNLTLTATAADADGQITNVQFFLNGSSAGSITNSPYSITVSNLAPANYTLTAVATDNDGLSTTSAPVAFLVYVDPGQPEATIFLPADSTIITAPTNIIGTASSPLLASYQVRYRLAPAANGTDIPTDNDGWTTLATGSTSIVSNTLASFDPTMLLNGIYQVQVVTSDLIGRTTFSDVTTLIVDRNLKVGAFTLSFEDLNVPVAGIPIQIVRTYDSRDQRTNDFGVGWSIDVRNVRLQKNRSLGPAWFEDSTGGLFPTYFIDPVNDRDLTVTLANGRQFKFSATFSPASQFGVPIDSGTVVYQPTADTYATLESIRGDDVFVSGSIPGSVDLFDVETSGLFNPTLFKLTTEEGEVYIIDEIEGLKSLSDRNGNTLLISTNGVLWTNTVTGGAAVGVTFERDPQGRISQIIDPQGNALNYTYGTNGSLASFTDRETNTTTFAYTNLAFPHYLTGITDPRGVQAIRTEYDSDGRMVRQTDGAGNVVNFTNDLSNNREIVRDRLGNVTIHEYDEDGNIVRTTDALGNVTASKYDANDNLLEQVDALGNTNSYTYDTKGNKLSETDPLGFTTQYTYGNFRRITSVQTPRGSVTTNLYDANARLVSTVDGTGATTTFSYNGLGLASAIVDAEGNVATNSFDAIGHLTNSIIMDSKFGKVADVSYSYDTNGNIIKTDILRTAPAGLESDTTSYVYDDGGRLLQTIYADGGSNVDTYAVGLNKVAMQSDQLGQQTFHYYDERGYETNTVLPDLSSISYQYDAENHKIAAIDQSGRVTSFKYDALGRLTNTTFADGSRFATVYDAVGRIAATVDANGNGTFFDYDASNRRIAVTNSLNQVTLSYYDEEGNCTNTVDALGRRTTFVYDLMRRLVKTINPNGSVRTQIYDSLGRQIGSTDEASNRTGFDFDVVGQLRSVTNALGNVTSYAYDELGNRVSQTDANNHTTTFEYDSLGRRVKRTLPGNQVETYAYNIGGLLTNRTDFNGYVTTYQYDLMNRLLAKVPDSRSGEPSITYGYNTLGLRTNMADASGSTTFTYDNRNRLVQKTKSWTGQATSVSLNYAYDLDDNLTNVVSSETNGVNVAYAYDELNRLAAVGDAQLGVTAYTYDNVGNLQGCTYPNFVHAEYQYDSLNRLTNLASDRVGTAIANYAYTVAASGNRTNAVEQLFSSALNAHASTINRVYTYDSLYRLTNETINGSSAAGYNYDPVGNRLGRSGSLLPSQTFTFDSDDRLNSDTYDANGNTLLGSGFGQSASDEYDFENRLVTRHTSSCAVHITYDGDGNRVSKTLTTSTNSVTTYYVVDELNPSGYAQVLEERVATNSQPSTLNCLYTYGHTLISQDRFSGSQWVPSFYGYDGHNNVRYLTDANANVTDTYDYDAFGNLIARTGSTVNHYLFTGEQHDADLGLYYLRARYHNSDTGRFWTMDVFEGMPSDPASLHKYIYCANDPVNRVDTSGHFWELLVGGIVHRKIASDFIALDPANLIPGSRPTRYANYTPISTILGVEYEDDFMRRPDLTDTVSHEIYEIKPWYSHLAGVAQLWDYIMIFTKGDPMGAWHPGSSYSPPPHINVFFGISADVYPPTGGVIDYKVNWPLPLVPIKVGPGPLEPGAEAEVDASVQELLRDIAANGEKYATMEIEEEIPVAAAEEEF